MTAFYCPESCYIVNKILVYRRELKNWNLGLLESSLCDPATERAFKQAQMAKKLQTQVINSFQAKLLQDE